jgi:antitoxin FitA
VTRKNRGTARKACSRPERRRPTSRCRNEVTLSEFKGTTVVPGDSIASSMAAVSIRDLDDDVKDRLRVRAARNGRSMEAEIRAILTDAVSEPDVSRGLFSELLERFGEIGGVELDLPRRANVARAPDLAG